MDHHRPGIWRIAGLHTSQEGQDGRRILGYPVIGPGHELELSDFSLFTGAILQQRQNGILEVHLGTFKCNWPFLKKIKAIQISFLAARKCFQQVSAA